MENREWENQIEERLGYQFQNRTLLIQALCHSSYANERKINKIEDYERLEFLGDAVLELVSSEFLFKEHPHMPEGEMTKTRASMVCEPALAFCARQIGLEHYILLGKGEEATGGRGEILLLRMYWRLPLEPFIWMAVSSRPKRTFTELF